MVAGFVIDKAGYTFQVVDQIYCRGHLPWVDEKTLDHCKYRSGDDLFENDLIETELLRLQDNPHQQRYSERIMNGYPIADAYAADRFTIFNLFSQFLETPSAIVFSSLIILFISFTLGYAIARSLNFKKNYSVLFGFLVFTPTYAMLFEAWNQALLGFGFLTLGMLQYYRFGRKRLFAMLGLLGASMILLSSIYQFYLYAALMGAGWFVVAIFSTREKSLRDGETRGESPVHPSTLLHKLANTPVVVFVIIAITFISALFIWNHEILSHLSFLGTSNKLAAQGSLMELIPRKGLALDPLGWVGVEPVIVHQQLLAVIAPMLSAKVQPVMTGLDSPGLPYLLLLFVGLNALWKRRGMARSYAVLVLLWLMYLAGPLQLLLSVLGPFKNETSVRGSYFFFLFGAYAVVYALRGLHSGSIRVGRRAWWIMAVAASYVLLISLILLSKNITEKTNYTEWWYHVMSVVAFLIGLWYLRRSSQPHLSYRVIVVLAISITIPISARLFFGAEPAVYSMRPSNLYFSRTRLSTELARFPNNDRLLLVQTNNGRPLHDNTALSLQRASVNAYRNPTDRAYLELLSYYRTFMIGGFSDEQASREWLTKYRQSMDYTVNGIAPIVLPGDELPNNAMTRNMLDLLGVSGVLGSSDLHIPFDEDWEKLIEANQLVVWGRTDGAPQYFFAADTTVIPNDADRLAFIFGSKEFNPERQVALDASIQLGQTPPPVSENAITLLSSDDGYRKFRVKISQPGILSIPAIYNDHWRARWTSGEALPTVRANYAFLGVVVPAGEGEIEITYNDQPRPWQKGVMIAGGLMFMGVFIFSRRGQPLLPNSSSVS